MPNTISDVRNKYKIKLLQLGKKLRRLFYTILEFCLQKLPALWMAAFKLKHLDEEKTDAICQALRVSLSNYFVIIHRAKLNLRECLQKNWI